MTGVQIRLPDEVADWPKPSFSTHQRRAVPELFDWSANLLSDLGNQNHVWSNNDCGMPVRFQLPGSSRNNIYVANPQHMSGVIEITGNDNIVFLSGGAPYQHHLGIHVCGKRSTLYIGSGCTFNHTEIFVTGDDMHVIIGDDCMFSHGTMIRTSDHHAIFDTDTGEWCNPPKSVIVEPHVWIGQDVLILKGSVIGKGSIVGARATVTGALPSKTLSTGSPAKVVRSNVSWTRDDQPSRDGIASVMTRLR